MGNRFTADDYYRLRTDFLKLKSALHDHNTQLVSYHARFNELRSYFERVRQLGLLVVDLADLSPLESIYGWQVFDDLLRRTGAALKGLRGGLLPSDALVALDGVAAERFVLFLATDAAGREVDGPILEGIADQLRERLQETFAGDAFRSMSLRPQFRVGHSLLTDDPFHRFERLVYRAIERGRTPDGGQMARRRTREAKELRRILDEGEMEVVFQPIQSLDGGDILGYEALSRPPEGSPFLEPRAMFDVSVELGLGFELDSLCQRRAILGAGALPEGRKLFVNALPGTCAGEGALPLEWLERAGMRPEDVVIEITERGPVDRWDSILREAEGLRRAGVGIALDDIGTGRTGLQGISELKPDYLKLDVSLVHNIQSNLIGQDLLRSLTQAARSIGARVVGEGVETEQELETLRDCGAEFGQGYLFARPGPAPPSE